MTSLRKSFVISAFSKYILLILQFISTTILARLLTPEDIGIYSIAFSIVAFGHLIRNFGVTQFIIQEKELTDDKIRAAFSLTFIIAWSVAAILFFCSDFISGLYDNKGISNLLKLLSLNFILLPFSSITQAYLRRKMEFGKIAIINIIPGFFAVTVAISSAFLGAKYYAMAFAANTEIIITILISLYFRPKELPFLPGIKKLPYIFAFGSKIGLSNISTQLTHSITDLLIGRFLGLASLGLYSRAYGTYMLFEYAILEAIGPVILPLFSKVKNRKGDLQKVFLKSVENTSVFSMPFFAFIFFFTDDFIHALYGNQWDTAIPVIKIFCYSGVCLSMIAFFDQIMISVNRANIILRYQLLSNFLLLTLLFPAAKASLIYVAWSFFAYVFARLLLAASYYKIYLKISFTPLFRIFSRGIIYTIIIMVPSITLFLIAPTFSDSIYIRLITLMCITFVSWLFTIFLFKHPFKKEIVTLISKFA